MIEALYAHSVTVCIIKLFYYSPLDICTHLNHLQRSYLISEENHTVALTLVLAYWSVQHYCNYWNKILNEFDIFSYAGISELF